MEIFAVGVDLHIVGRVAGVVIAGDFLKKDGVDGTHQGLPVCHAHLVGHGDGAAGAGFLGVVIVLTGHLVGGGAGAAGVGEDVHVGKAALADE